LAGAPFWLYAGGVAPCPEPRGLKARRPVFRQVINPRLPGPFPGNGFDQPNRKTVNMQTILERPADSADAIPPGLAVQQRERETTLLSLARLRKEAAAEIDRLIAFLDACDPYVTTELEENGDEKDSSYPGSGSHLLGNPNEDDEDGADDEPSLGSHGHGGGGPIMYLQHVVSTGYSIEIDCEGDEHDGREPEDESDDSPDNEPSLGWTVDGVISNTPTADCDAELSLPTVGPQNRTNIPGADKLIVETTYRRFLHGLSPEHKALLSERRQADSGVVTV